MAGKLKKYLDKLVLTYKGEYVPTDPVKYPHRFEDVKDIEVAAVIASVFAYGNIKVIFKSLDTIFNSIGSSPFKFAKNFTQKSGERIFHRFVHRFNGKDDLITLFSVLSEIYKKNSSLEDFFLEGFNLSDKNVEAGIAGFSKRIIEKGKRYKTYKKSFNFLFPSPSSGSGCKRFNMFLRWMVRNNDGVDFGLWKSISKSQLVFPLDTHTGRITTLLGLSERKGASWKKALEVTENLKTVDENDPVKYDFALSRLGILKLCPNIKIDFICRECVIYPICKTKGG